MAEFNHHQDETGGILRGIVAFVVLLLIILACVWAGLHFKLK